MTVDEALARRNKLLAETDWMILRNFDEIEIGRSKTLSLTPGQLAALSRYRQALRDWPASRQFPEGLPVKPPFLP